jgi:hypothetical protein
MNEATATIKFTKSEIENIIISLVHASRSAEIFGNTEISKNMTKIKNDLVVIKINLNKAVEEKQNGLLEEGQAPYCKTCD